MEIIKRIQLPATGASWTGAANANTIVVRQDTKLFTYKVKAGKLDKTLDMEEYQAVPCIIFDNKFYELEDDRIVVVDLDSMY